MENFKLKIDVNTKKKKVVGFSGMISAGKTYMSKRIEAILNSTDPNVIAYIQKNFPLLSGFLGRTKSFCEIPDGKLLDRYYKALALIEECRKKGKKLSKKLVLLIRKVAFDTQIYFLSLRIATDTEKLGYDGLIIEDRTWAEDTIFAEMVFKQGNMSKTQFDIYKRFFDNLTPRVISPDLRIFFKVSPKRALFNLCRRIEKLKLENKDTKGEENIKLQYLTDLYNEYCKWADMMEKKFKNFIVLDCETDRKPEDVLKIIEDKLGSPNTPREDGGLSPIILGSSNNVK